MILHLRKISLEADAINDRGDFLMLPSVSASISLTAELLLYYAVKEQGFIGIWCKQRTGSYYQKKYNHCR